MPDGVDLIDDFRYSAPTMSQDQLIQLKHAATGEVYWTRKNKKLVTKKIELKKYSPKLRKHVLFKETKK
jgi:large subunit ribosomal protein L33